MATGVEKQGIGNRGVTKWEIHSRISLSGSGQLKRAWQSTSSLLLFLPQKKFGLTSQLRRASISVPSNIAEGCGKSSSGEYLSYLGHARGSNGEVQTQLVIAHGLEFGSPESLLEAESLSNEVGRMLVVMMNRLKR
jgi:four helix bundle protein